MSMEPQNPLMSLNIEDNPTETSALLDGRGVLQQTQLCRTRMTRIAFLAVAAVVVTALVVIASVEFRDRSRLVMKIPVLQRQQQFQAVGSCPKQDKKRILTDYFRVLTDYQSDNLTRAERTQAENHLMDLVDGKAVTVNDETFSPLLHDESQGQSTYKGEHQYKNWLKNQQQATFVEKDILDVLHGDAKSSFEGYTSIRWIERGKTAVNDRSETKQQHGGVLSAAFNDNCRLIRLVAQDLVIRGDAHYSHCQSAQGNPPMPAHASQGSCDKSSCFANCLYSGSSGVICCSDYYQWYTCTQAACGGPPPSGCYPLETYIRTSVKESETVRSVLPTHNVFSPFQTEDAVVFLGHAMILPETTAFVEILTVRHMKRVAATGCHFIGVVDRNNKECLEIKNWNRRRYDACAQYTTFRQLFEMRKQDQNYVFVVQKDGTLELDMINANFTRLVQRRGLFDPVTLSGTIVANDVLLSTHVEWHEGPVWSWWPTKWLHMLPYVYQHSFWIFRVMYRIVPSAHVRAASVFPKGMAAYPWKNVIRGALRLYCQELFKLVEVNFTAFGLALAVVVTSGSAALLYRV